MTTVLSDVLDTAREQVVDRGVGRSEDHDLCALPADLRVPVQALSSTL